MSSETLSSISLVDASLALRRASAPSLSESSQSCNHSAGKLSLQLAFLFGGRRFGRLLRFPPYRPRLCRLAGGIVVDQTIIKPNQC
eukprot:m.140826 g.140826  ORF g.140826 m.140826 type:complete len:86 (+) comp16115_c0_seq11:2250-2507(+)